MDTFTTSPAHRPTILEPGGGTRYHFLDNLATVKVAAGEDGDLSVVEFLAPRGFGPPMHRHNHEDELFVVLEGQIDFITGDTRRSGSAGVVALLPRAVPHTFQVVSDTARILNVTGSQVGAPRFDQMVSALGVPTDSSDLPALMDIDPGQVAEVCAAHGIDIVGPPPAPLD